MNSISSKVSRNLCICIVMFLLVVIMSFFFIARFKKGSIIIGFSAQLTGSQSELGVQERNGVQLAIEKINDKGGIGGRNLSLIIHDDLGTANEAMAGDSELIKKGVVAIIGHATTAQAMAGLKVTNPQHVVMISPTVSSPDLCGLDDYFFSLYPSFENSSKNFAKYAYKTNDITSMAIIYDNDNLAYSKTYCMVFSRELQSLGGNIIDEVSFSSAEHPDFSPLLSKLRSSKAEGLLIVASDIDAAFIAQRARLIGWQVPMFSAAWAQTETLINNGGKAVEDMKIEQAYTLSSKSQAFIDFQSRYKARFGKEPSFGAAFSYETTLVLSEALKKTCGSKDGLKQALLETNKFNGMINTFSFNKYGDVKRPRYLSTIRDGKFIIIDKLSSSDSEGE